ncbi:hypothetical protein [Cohnella hongkongensis]|uniref:Alpha/beta hydrolase n=1 Tax=Cohnella hongkongensis TaxID=178337 RepID=A0ABV9F4Y0_9BACL
MSGPQDLKVDIYLLAGLGTAPGFMENLRIMLTESLLKAEVFGRPFIRSSLLYPYGDWSRNVVAQLWEIRADMRRGAARLDRSIGGGRALADIARERAEAGDGEESGTTLLVGHSGGGVAAVHAAELLLKSGVSSCCFAVKIGSPRCRVPERMKPRVLSIFAEGRRKDGSVGPSPDFVSRIGSYGGWTRKRGLPCWTRNKHAPAAFLGVPIVGKHADYFRDREPYFNTDGRSNLELIVDSIVGWLTTVK